MVSRLHYKGSLQASQISEYERDIKEPPVQVMLCYARAVNIAMECLVDDELDLPSKLLGRK
jgi:hypothetical protein